VTNFHPTRSKPPLVSISPNERRRRMENPHAVPPRGVAKFPFQQQKSDHFARACCYKEGKEGRAGEQGGREGGVHVERE